MRHGDTIDGGRAFFFFMAMTSRGFFLLLAALLVPGPGSAQGTDFLAVRDSLATVQDVSVLRRMQSQLPMPGMARSADALVVRGLIALRIYELTSDRDDSRAAQEVFERATERFPDVPWLQYGAGLAYASAPEIRLAGGPLQNVTVGQSVAEILGRDPKARALRSLRRALELDPSFGPAAVRLAELAVADGRDRDALVDGRAWLVGAREAGDSSSAVLAALADVETALGDYGAAASAASAAAAGGDPAAMVARSVALLLQPGSADRGTVLYFEAVDGMGEAEAERLYGDVEPIVQANEAADWKVADLEGRRQWLRRFWTRRAAESGVLVSERLAEHYGRLAIARREYLRNSRRGAAGAGALVDVAVDSSPFDDRGLILIRRGLPQRVVTTTRDGVLPNETWIYTEPGSSQSRVFHFAALRGSRDYSLISDLLRAVDPTVGRGDLKEPGVLGREENAVLQLLEDRAPYIPEYQAAVGQIRSRLAEGYTLQGTEVRSTLNRVDADYRQRARQALGTDVLFARFERALDFHYDLFAFRTPFGRTDLTAGFAVRAGDLASEELSGGRVAYPMLVSVILIDTLSDVVTRRDTLARVEEPARLGPDGFVRTHVEVPVVPSEHTIYRVSVRSPAVSAGSVQSGGAVLRDFDGTGLEVSDLVLAEPDTAGDWTRGATRLMLTLPRRYPPGRPFTLFYEVYNLPTDARYRTHVRVEAAGGGGAFGRIKRLFGGGGPKIDVRYQDVADPDGDGVIQEVRRVDTGLPPGRYRMRVTVENEATGETAESVAEFEVVN